MRNLHTPVQENTGILFTVSELPLNCERAFEMKQEETVMKKGRLSALFLIIFLAMPFISPPVYGNNMSPDALSIYSRRTGDFITVEKMEETVIEQGTNAFRRFELSIVTSRDDNEMRQIQGSFNGQSIEGTLQGKGFDLELQLRTVQNNRIMNIKNVMEKRGDRLDIDFDLSGGGRDLKQSLVAVNKPNKIQVYSEDESEKTSFYILFKQSEITIFGNLKGSPIEYTISLPAQRKWFTTEELITGAIHLALTGYFIF
jgi:hypothetical protein